MSDGPRQAPPAALAARELAIVVAAAKNGAIGLRGQLPWQSLPDDLKHFKRLTLGHTVVMGRRTWDSILRPLPGRRNVVLTSRRDLAAPGVIFLPDWDALAALPVDSPPTFIIGGAALIADTLPIARDLYLTRVHAELEGDVFLPPIDFADWQRLAAKPHAADLQHDYAFTIEHWRRR